jgi:hypothetical protein
MITRVFALLGLALIVAVSPAIADPPAAPTASPAPVVPGVSLPPSVMNNPIVQDALRALTGAATRELGLDPNWSRGRVTYFRRFDMQIETVPNKYRQIHLHQGTIINPRGTTLAPGMNVRVSGVHQQDGSLNANEITVVN